MRVSAMLLIPTLALVGVSCGSNDEGDAGGGAEVAVTGTDDACTLASTELAAGKTTFVFTNKSKQVNEIYVKTANDKIVKEIENVVTGQIRKMTVTLEAGKTYKVQCKPGQKGDGFTTDITVK